MDLECRTCGRRITASAEVVARIRKRLHCPSRFADFSVVHEALRLRRLKCGECGSKDVSAV